MLPPPEVSRNPGQDPIFNFGGDGVGPNANSTMILTEGSRKGFREDHGDAESGPVRRLVASEFGTVNAKLDNALKKVASQQIEIDHLRKKLDEANDYNWEQWNHLAVKWASMEKLLEHLNDNSEQTPRRQERLGQQP
jgi:flagellar capping protein FliD